MGEKRTVLNVIVGIVILGGVVVFLASRKPNTPQQEQAQPSSATKQPIEPVTSQPAVEGHYSSQTTLQASIESSDEIILKEEPSVPQEAVVGKDQLSIEGSVADAKAAMSRKAYDKAQSSLHEALSITSDPDERMRLGQMLYECLIRTHSYDDALMLGHELLTLNPSPQEKLVLTQQLAALLHRMGRADEAEQLLREAMEAEQVPATKERLQAQLRGVWRHTEGRTAQVVSDLTAKLEQNPQDEDALQALGNIYMKSRRDYEAALPIYEQLAALNPDDTQTQSTLLGLYRKTKNFDGMRRVYEKRLEQAGGDDPALRLSIAQTELQAGRGDVAVEYAEQYLSGPDATPFELQMLSTVYDKAGRKNTAVATLDTAITRETNAQQRVSMQFQKVDMLTWSKQYEQAEAELRGILSGCKDDRMIRSRVNSELIRLYQMQGRMGELDL